jgi:hypothetical protein
MTCAYGLRQLLTAARPTLASRAISAADTQDFVHLAGVTPVGHHRC